MLIAICIILSVSFLAGVVAFRLQKTEHSRNCEMFEGAMRKAFKEVKEKDDTISFLEQVAGELGRQVQTLEDAISSQLLVRSSEVGFPPASGAYHTLFTPTGNGKVMAVYICLDSGHVARWHFNSADSLEEEGKRFIKAAEELREGTLPDVPFMANIPIGGTGVLH